MKLQRGVGLIEVLVAVLLIGTSLLAMSAMQVRSVAQNNEALIRTQANLVAYDIFERIRMASPMAPAQLVRPSAETVNKLVSAVVAGGTGELSCDTQRHCKLDITWVEFSRGSKELDKQLSTFTYATRL